MGDSRADDGVELRMSEAVVADVVPEMSDPRWRDALQLVIDDPTRLALHAQPIVELTSGTVAGFEMLSRFDGPWPATPDKWFAAAERHGCNGRLQARVLRRALAARNSLPPDTFLTVNLDPHLLRHPAVATALTGASDLSRIVLELTEHSPMRCDPDEVALLAHVRAAGGMVAIDDAGTGYAGLSTMLALRPEIVKLDRELVQGLDQDPVKRALVEVIGDLAGRMDAWILAEGIETEDELAAVIALGVPLGQGWALARPSAVMTADLPAHLADGIRATARRTSLREHVVSLIRPAHTEVVLDGRGRAVQVRPDGAGAPMPATLVAPSTTIADAARRAVARPAEHRFAPLVCTDGAGVVLGVVRIDDVLSALAASSSAEDGR
jgi:EAL domain-containing protein (putative c-di-GMP-specific phosphodiesterase class I)